MATTIFTMTHKAFQVPQNPTYQPLQVGRALHEDLGYLGDDTGDSISDLNGYYGELTGIYWLWKNYDSKDNIGVCHYRRFFMNQENQLLSGSECDEILKEHDIITSQAIQAPVPYLEYYGEAHEKKDMLLTGEVIRQLYPEDYQAFTQVMQGRKYYFGNLMVTSREHFDQYCQWLFSIFAQLGDQLDVSAYDEYRKRIFGFLSEELLLVWITARNLKVYECKIGITDEKAETKELKLALTQLVKNKQISEARTLFYEVIKIRPDVALELSDIRQEFPAIEQILYICEEEKKRGQQGMLSITTELPELISYHRQLTKILIKYPNWDEADKALLKKLKVTDTAVEVVSKNNRELQQHWQEVLLAFRNGE